MVTRRTVRDALVGREVALAYAGIIALYLVRVVEFQPLQIPAYLLIVAYDLVEGLLPFLTPYYAVGFPAFLYLLAVIGAAAARWLRPDDGGESAWTRTAGGVCLVVGVLALLFGAFVAGPLVSRTDNPTPLAIAGATAAVFLAGAWWLLRHRSGPASASA